MTITLQSAKGLITVSDDGIAILDDAASINFRGFPVSSTGDQINVDAAIDVRDGGGTIAGESQFLNFGNNITPVVSGDGTTLTGSLQIKDGGVSVEDKAEFIDLGNNLTAVVSGAGVQMVGSIETQDSGTTIGQSEFLNFGTSMDVTSNADGVNIDVSSTGASADKTSTRYPRI